MVKHKSVKSTKVRLQKVLSQAGLGSRRQMEQWIEQGLVEVNGKIASIGDGVSSKDRLKVRGKVVHNPLKHVFKTRILIYHKPIGEISSRTDPKHHKTIFDNLPILNKGRWIQVGRLDINTQGLMLFTNNGELANHLMHPKQQFEREYAVRIYGEVTDEMIRKLKQGVTLDDGLAAFKSIQRPRAVDSKNAWYHVTLTEGRHREVRRLWAAVGVEVSRLVRVRFASIKLPRHLPRGQCLELPESVVHRFTQSLEDPHVSKNTSSH